MEPFFYFGDVIRMGNGNQTHQQHFLPRVYLKNFSKDGQIFGYNIRTKQGMEKGPKGWCYIYDFYEIVGVAFNEMEGIFAKRENEVESYLTGMGCGDELTYDQMLPVLKFASLLDVRSPSALEDMVSTLKDSCLPWDPELSYELIVDHSKRWMRKKLNETEYELSGIPYEELAISCTKWPFDILVTNDCPVVRCDLRSIARRESDRELDGFILPIDMRTLFLIFRIEDKEAFEDLFCQAPGLIDPIKVNRVMVGNAIETVFFKDDSNPIFGAVDQIVLNPNMVETYVFLFNERKRAEEKEQRDKEEARKRSS